MSLTSSSATFNLKIRCPYLNVHYTEWLTFRVKNCNHKRELHLKLLKALLQEVYAKGGVPAYVLQ